MANKLFKGFKQVTAGSFEAEDGYIYFVRNQSNTGMTDGYIQFNGRMYGTAAEVAADLEGKIGTLPNGYDNVVDYIDAQVTAITGNYATNETVGTLSGRVDTLETSAATKTEVGTLSGRVDTIENDYLTSTDKTSLEGAIGTVSGRVDSLEAISADTRLDVLETSAATKTEVGTLSGRVDTLEAISADTRLDVLEASAHTHSNKDVLDTIDQAKVNAWDAMAGGAAVVLSSYTGNDTGLTEGYLKTYEVFQGGVSVGKIDIPKDLVVTNGQIVEVEGVKYLRLTIANSSTPVDIAVTDLVDVYTQGDGIEISNSNVVSAKVVAANGLSVDTNGIQMAAASDNNAGAMSAADYTKLGTIAASAQTNVIEEVKVDGTALTITNKSVNIELPDYSGTYAPLSLTGDVADNRTDFDNYTAATDTRLDTIESGYTQKATYDAYTAATDTRLDTIESGYTQKATYDAYTAATDASISSADTRLATIESGYTQKATYDAYTAATDASISSADTRLQALEALTGDTSSALQSISEGDASVTVGAKDSNNDQTVAVNISSAAGNAIELKSDGLYAAIYYDGNDSD